MIRPDSHILKSTLKQYRKSKKLPKQIAKAATQPLLWFADKDMGLQPFLNPSEEESINPFELKYLSPAEWIYQDFIFCVRRELNYNGVYYPKALVWTHISVNPTNPQELTVLLLLEADTHWNMPTGPMKLSSHRNWHRNLSTLSGKAASNILVWTGGIRIKDGLIEEELLTDQSMHFTAMGVEQLRWLEDVYQTKPSNKEDLAEFWSDATSLGQWASASVCLAMQLMLYCKYGDRHPVEVVPEKSLNKQPTLNRNRLWASSTGPRLLLLDRMPTTQRNQGGGGTHASPKPHRRRGHWKTLRHPRYRHHPQYLQKIYCKPSFVGPKQVNYEGNIYRLVQPLEEIMNHGA